MSAEEVTARSVLENWPNYDLVILNFANPDMVGHTGVVEAAIKAVEIIDACVRAVVDETLELGGKLLITADHGNCEFMINADGSPHTAHTTNLVHLLYVAEDADELHPQGRDPRRRRPHPARHARRGPTRRDDREKPPPSKIVPANTRNCR